MRAVTLLSILMIFSGCAGDFQTGIDPSQDVKLQRYEDLALPHLQCANASECPESIGQLITYTQRGLEKCTFALVGADRILTASHCLPLANIADDQTIRGNCWARFPGTQPISCKKVLKASRMNFRNLETIQDDYAYIQLDRPVHRKFLSVGQTRKSRGHFKMFGVTPADKRKEFDELIQLKCQAEKDIGLLTRKTTSPNAFIFPTCAVRHGHSGGPILDSSGIVGGIVGVISFLDTKDVAVGTKVPLL